jgi:hemoglobin/transferrin/lactoferrin receptor protein
LIRPTGDGQGLRSAEWNYGPQNWLMGNLQILKKGKDNFFDRMKLTLAYQNFQESRYERDFGDDVRYSTAEKVDAVSMNFDIENKRLGNLRLYYGGEYVYN